MQFNYKITVDHPKSNSMYLFFTRAFHRLTLFLFTLILTIAGTSAVKSQTTTLVQGDLSIIGWNGGTDRGVAFVTWVNLATNTEIRFMDNGFFSSSPSTAASNVRWSESLLIWTATAPVTAGTVIYIENEYTNVGSVNAINASGTETTVLNFSNTGGDQVFAYQGVNMPTAPTPAGTGAQTFNNTILFGLGFQGANASSQTTWLTTGTAGTATSYLPSDLVSPNRVYHAGTATAGEYTGTRTAYTTAAQYRTAIENPANWTTLPGLGTDQNYTTTAFQLGTPPSISAHPGTSTICAAGNTSFTVTANDPVSYQWQVDNGSGYANVANGGVYSNATTATLNITGATAGMSGYSYRCVVTGTAAPAATSNGATLTVNSAPAISTQPSVSSVCTGGNTSFSVVASNATGYQWQVNFGAGFSNIANGGVYSNATTATLNITGATAGMSGYAYRVVVSGTCTPSKTSTSTT